MRLPRNTWCDGSGGPAKAHSTEYGKCPECGYKFRLTGVVPKHRPRFNAKAKGA